MASVVDTIQSAYRRGGIVAAGVNINAKQKDIGLERLKGWYNRMALGGKFGALHDKRLTTADAYEAQEYERVINTAAAAITLPSTVQDDFDGTDRTPRDMCVITTVVPGSNPVVKVYDAVMAAWVDINSLTLTGYAPLTFRYDDHIKNLLAVELCDEVGYSIPPMLALNAKAAQVEFASRHGSDRKPVQHEFF